MKEALLYQQLTEKEVRCLLCAHNCRIKPKRFGICGVRQNIDGKLFTHAYGSVVAEHLDPIEKKPLYHFLPGTFTYSIATQGCNFRCGFCQNWQISQRKIGQKSLSPAAELVAFELAPTEAVRRAQANGCPSISFTYTEPTIFFEYALEIARLATAAGLKNIFVTNGYMTELALTTIAPYLNAANVDLKAFSEKFYKTVCGGSLAPVLSTIRKMVELGIWVEVTTLVIPGQNDTPAELRKIAQFLVSVSPEIPWHLSRFHPDYQFLEYPPTDIEVLLTGKKIALEAGLKHVHLGNIPLGV